MELPKFLLGDNTDFPDDIFIIHLDYPRFIINLKDDEVEFMEEAEDLDEAELNAEMEGLIVLANEFYDREDIFYEYTGCGQGTTVSEAANDATQNNRIATLIVCLFSPKRSLKA